MRGRRAALGMAGAALAGMVIGAGGAAAGRDPPAQDQIAAPELSSTRRFAGPDADGRRPALDYEGELTQGGYIRGRLAPGNWTAQLGGAPIEIGGDGSFFAAFDRDSPLVLVFRAADSDGIIVAETLTITPRNWAIERVGVGRGRGTDLEAYWARREPEHNAIRDARAQRTGANGWQQDFIWPVRGRISGYFGRQRIYAGEPGPYHSGIDIAAGGGAAFVAPASGVVVLARTGFSLEGGIIILDHGAGLNSAFIHLSKLTVAEGQSVEQGQYLGNVGATGRATGPHLHWSMVWNEARLDPLLFTGPMN